MYLLWQSNCEKHVLIFTKIRQKRLISNWYATKCDSAAVVSRDKLFRILVMMNHNISMMVYMFWKPTYCVLLSLYLLHLSFFYLSILIIFNILSNTLLCSMWFVSYSIVLYKKIKYVLTKLVLAPLLAPVMPLLCILWFIVCYEAIVINISEILLT